MNEAPGGAEVRPYEPDDATMFWELKRGFELGLGAGTGDDDKLSIYEAKLTDDYRERYLSWVERCAADSPGYAVIAEAVSDGRQSDKSEDATLVGYAFTPPEEVTFIRDAAVLNEPFFGADYRGSSAADELMDTVLAHARSQDLPLDRIVLDVDKTNDRARTFYECYGFDYWDELIARDL